MSKKSSSVCAIVVALTILLGGTDLHAEKPADKSPPAAEIVAMLKREPITLESWPSWRTRLLDWIGDKSQNAEPAYEAARAFVLTQADASGNLRHALSKDAFAWYMLGSGYIYSDKRDPGKAETALRRSIELDPKFARAHRNLAFALHLQEPSGAVGRNQKGPVLPTITGPKRREARKELDEAHRLDPALSTKPTEFQMALVDQDFARAEELARELVQEEPNDVHAAKALAMATVLNATRVGLRAPAVEGLMKKFPEDADLVSIHGVALAIDERYRDARNELRRARSMGGDPERLFPAEALHRIEDAGAPGLFEQVAWVMGGFLGFYTIVMLSMAGAGVVLAGRTRGTRALGLLGNSDEMISQGQIARTSGESLLARIYAFCLFLGLILFYVSIPFVLVGLLAVTGGMLYLIFMMGRIPVKLVVIIVVVGLGSVWAVLKSLFARAGSGSFGIQKNPEDFPRLHQALLDVAKRVDTEPIHEVYLAPGSSIGVHQEGRGPFGIFGIKRRVLTLGMSTLHFLTVSELKSILAHEYAHFSHNDTFYSRFIYRVQMSIESALRGMGETGGKLNYVNPFFWFLYLYYKSYELLSAGYSRSREFLADRMACTLYGSDVFASALRKVCTEGALFEKTIYGNISGLLSEGKAFVNMYEAFRNYRNEQLNDEDRSNLQKELMEEKESLFASHPTFKERVEAVEALPRASEADATPAVQLFDHPEELEKELTEFLTAFVEHIHHLQAQAAAQQG
jgi:Zn-dependent protease with chaperone function/Flp pilus assembly protein TadD